MIYALALLTLGLSASAISVTSPTNTTVWSSGTSGQTVSWEAVSTDPTSFEIQLVNQAGFLTNSPVTLVANQTTGSANVVNSVTVTYSAGTWPVGTAFQINLMGSSSGGSSAILAQSQQFNITSDGSSSSSSSASSSASSSSSAAASSSTVTTSTVTASSAAVAATSDTASETTGGNASGGIPSAVCLVPSSCLYTLY
ncbi:hypothetical protein P7C73_g4086, partial [Tremellales sp. Uapishka_1]